MAGEMKFNDPIKRPWLDIYTKEEVLAMLPQEYEKIYQRYRYLKNHGRLEELRKRKLARMEYGPAEVIARRRPPSTIETRKLQGLPVEKMIRAINGGMA